MRPGRAARIASIDVLRGLVMVIMALDHVRDYWSITPFAPADLEHTTSAYFLTRWITHFCAPIFVLLAGVSAALYQRNKQAGTLALSRFLLSRGVWLIVLEVTVISFFWQAGYSVIIAQVIWVIGWSMLGLAGLVFLPRPAVLGIGLLMILGHNALDTITPQSFLGPAWLWHFLHVQGYIQAQLPLGIQGVWLAYPLIPWIGVMAVGYGLAPLLEKPVAERRHWMYALGFGAIVLFVLLRAFNGYGEPGIAPADSSWTDHGRGLGFAVMSFVNTTKYPPSLLFLLMTIGPALAVLPLMERWRGATADFLAVFGRVPLFFYILHIPLIHASALAWVRLRFGVWGMNPMTPQAWPADYSPNLLRAYLVWVLLIAFLYWPCRWFMNYRKTHKQWWLSYL